MPHSLAFLINALATSPPPLTTTAAPPQQNNTFMSFPLYDHSWSKIELTHASQKLLAWPNHHNHIVFMGSLTFSHKTIASRQLCELNEETKKKENVLLHENILSKNARVYRTLKHVVSFRSEANIFAHSRQWHHCSRHSSAVFFSNSTCLCSIFGCLSAN